MEEKEQKKASTMEEKGTNSKLSMEEKEQVWKERSDIAEYYGRKGVKTKLHLANLIFN